jgi:hypothetical protein
MNLKEIKTIAKRKGVEAATMRKDELIRAIQRHEGYDDCFGNNARAKECGQMNCVWRKDCA